MTMAQECDDDDMWQFDDDLLVQQCDDDGWSIVRYCDYDSNDTDAIDNGVIKVKCWML